MDEVRLAVEKGYRILEIYEVYEYQVTQYSSDNSDGGLFVDYINTSLKTKGETSGHPRWVRSPADEERYVESFWKNVGISPEKEYIKSNTAKWGLAKICLYTMWGKLTERNDRTQEKIYFGLQKTLQFLATTSIEVTNLAIASDDLFWVT